jgi:hypothetical protein
MKLIRTEYHNGLNFKTDRYTVKMRTRDFQCECGHIFSLTEERRNKEWIFYSANHSKEYKPHWPLIRTPSIMSIDMIPCKKDEANQCCVIEGN